MMADGIVWTLSPQLAAFAGEQDAAYVPLADKELVGFWGKSILAAREGRHDTLLVRSLQ